MTKRGAANVGRGLAPAEYNGDICPDGQAIFPYGKRYYAFGIAICLPCGKRGECRAGACSRHVFPVQKG